MAVPPTLRSSHLASRNLPARLALACLVLAGCAKQTSTQAEQAAEAGRLYARADDFVKKIGEGSYSYDYINFHYNQAMKNVDRILTAYPETEEARRLQRGELKLGNYTLVQFRDTILPQLGDLKEATESAENCAIYLHNLPEAAKSESRAALALILETLCRKVRADEALIFPTEPGDALLAKTTITRIVSTGAQKGIGLSLVQGAEPDEQAALAAAYAQGQAIGGLKLADLEALPERFPSPNREVELGILCGMIERMENITRNDRDQAMREKAALARGEKLIATPVRRPESVRYDVAAYYQQAFGARPQPAATAAYAGYLAFQGDLAGAQALARPAGEPALEAVITSYYDFLGLNDRLTGRETLHRESGLSREAAARCDLKLVEFTARNNLLDQARALQSAGTAENPALRDLYIRSFMRGIFYSRVALFHLTDRTLVELDIKDPAVCAQVLLDWVLSPNRLLKGSSWGADQVLFKYFSMQRADRPVSRQQKSGKS